MVQQQKSFEKQRYGILYLIPTPIGNLEDMTYRAVRLLNEVNLIASEDTRHTQKLLNYFDIKTPQISCHEHNILERIPQLIECLKRGEMIAQVSDAGMPSISDPGHELVKACIAEDISVVALPGANAALTALIASGLSAKQFYFYGFLPRKKSEQLCVFKTLKGKEETLMFYESPFRLKKTLQAMLEVFSENRQVVICRELTKKYEEYIRGSLQEISKWIEQAEIKGEICLLVSGALEHERQEVESTKTCVPEHCNIPDQVQWLMEHEILTKNEAIKRLAKQLGRPKQDIYKIVHGG